MSVTQYIGARYVPLFADPLTWDITKAYEALTIVYYQGNSFTSRQAVPAGIDITNADYWALTGNYNAQIEQYRAEVQTYDNRITANTSSNTAQDAQLAGTSSSGLKTLIDGNASDIDALEGQMAGTSTSGLKTLIETNASDIDALEGQMAGTSTSGLKTLIDANASDIESVSNARIYNDMSDKIIVTIGDSMTRALGATKSWPVRVGETLDCEVYNFAVDACGFVLASSGGVTFSTEVDHAIASSSFVNSEVTDVIVMGGYNDHSQAISAVYSAANALFQKIRANFANATIHFGAMLKGVTPLDNPTGSATNDNYRSRFIHVLEQAALQNKVCIIPHPWTWAMPYYSEAYYDNVHVNDFGQDIFAGNVVSYLRSGCIGSCFMEAHMGLTDVASDYQSDFEIVDVRIMANGDTVTIRGRLKTSATVSHAGQMSGFITLPEWARSSTYGQIALIGAGGYTDDANPGYGSHVYVTGTTIVPSHLVASRNYWIDASWPYGI